MVAERLITADVRPMSWSSRIVIKGEEEEVVLESTECGNPDTVPLTICSTVFGVVAFSGFEHGEPAAIKLSGRTR